MAKSTHFVALASLASLCSAGLQVPLVIINLSPYPASIDMTLDEHCIKHDYNPIDLEHYYNSWESSDLGADYGSDYEDYNDYLQQYKSQLGVPELKNSLAEMAGLYTIPALTLDSTNNDTISSPYAVFQTEMNGDVFEGCFGKESHKSFSITVNGSMQSFTISDPPDDPWTLSMDSPTSTQLTIGSGGHASWGTILWDAITGTLAVLSLGSWGAMVEAGSTAGARLLASQGVRIVTYAEGVAATKAWFYGIGASFSGLMQHIHQKDPSDTQAGLNVTVDQASMYLGFGDLYSQLTDDQRKACILGDNIWGNYDCLVAGTSLVIQGNGQVLAVPLPNIYRAWHH